MILAYDKTKNFAVNCRCGKRSIWKVPEDIAMAVENNTAFELQLGALFPGRQKQIEESGEGRTMVALKGLAFECKCGRFFELTQQGLTNVTDGVTCDDWMKQKSPSKMLN